MRITFISDTHGNHKHVKLDAGDLLIHCGDISYCGSKRDIISFYEWFTQQPFTHKIFIAGNHDAPLALPLSHIKKWVPYNCHYLENSGVEVNGLRIWGSPYTPTYTSAAFTLNEAAELQQCWDLIPTDTDILITHGPAQGVQDFNSRGVASGCTHLARKLHQSQVKVHAYGHIHEAHGYTQTAQRLCINASVVNKEYRVCNQPTTITYRDGQFFV